MGLQKTLGTFQLWGIAVGLVISGEYFGWSCGWALAGTLGFLVSHVQYPWLEPRWVAVGAHFELLVFMGVVAPAFSLAHFVRGGWAGQDTFSTASLGGNVAALPFAIWFFLAIEGVAMAAEEVRDPRRSIPRAYIGGIITLVLARIHPRFHMPHVAILAGGAVGLAAIFSDRLVSIAGQTLTATIVTLSVFGAIVMYIVSMASLFRLRRTQPDLPRPFRAPGYPWVPGFALACAVVCLGTMVHSNPQVARWFGVMMAVGLGSFVAVRGTGERPLQND